jgi:hypothetical protein
MKNSSPDDLNSPGDSKSPGELYKPIYQLNNKFLILEIF